MMADGVPGASGAVKRSLKMRSSLMIPLAALGAIAILSGGALAGAAPEEAISLLQERGYSDVEIEPSETPGYQAWGCKSGTRFAINLDGDSNIVDVDPVGTCGAGPGQPAAGEDLHVRVPFADIRVGKGGVHIRAPFVDLYIPR